MGRFFDKLGEGIFIPLRRFRNSSNPAEKCKQIAKEETGDYYRTYKDKVRSLGGKAPKKILKLSKGYFVRD